MKAAFKSSVNFGPQTVRRINKKQGWRFANGQKIGANNKRKDLVMQKKETAE